MTGAGRREPGERSAGDGRATRHGPGRLLIAAYAVFAISASARAGVQLATRFAEAPLAYLLSGFAAAVYIVATIALARSTPRSRAVAWAAVVIELLGVLTVGTLTRLDAADFPEATVWSGFGQGYGYVPLLLPVLGLAWLRHTRPAGTRVNPSSRG